MEATMQGSIKATASGQDVARHDGPVAVIAAAYEAFSAARASVHSTGLAA
jgi:hypothetical protein